MLAVEGNAAVWSLMLMPVVSSGALSMRAVTHDANVAQKGQHERLTSLDTIALAGRQVNHTIA